MSTKHTVEFTHEIEGGPHDGLEINVTAEFVREPGEFIEPGHPWNGLGEGWYIERMSVSAPATETLPELLANPILDDELEDILLARATQLFERRP